MAKSKFTTCKTCGGEMAKNAKACPHCGAPHKKPFYKRFLFWFLIAVLGAGVFVWEYKDKFLEEHANIDKAIKLAVKMAKKH